jgi:NYN domain-containing protein
MAKVIVYVDGFNLYYGCLKREPADAKWLDLQRFAQQMLPRDTIVGIKYFTAIVDPRPGKLDAPVDQRLYLRALRTLPNLSIYLGRFLTTEIWARRVDPPAVGAKTVKVFKTEEKGSDVNLATQLLIDGFKENYELAVVVSNDGDLKGPIAYVREQLGLPVGVLNPRKNRSYALSPPDLPRGSFYKPIRKGAIKSSQFPDSLTDARGTFHKPADW